MRGSLVFALMLAGCGHGDEVERADAAPPGDARADAAPSAPGDDVELGPFPGWPAEIASRRVGSTFKTSVTKLELAEGGRVWLLRNEFPDSSPTLGRPVLERYGPKGGLERRVTFAEQALVPAFVVHPSGELTVLELRPEGSAGQYRLELARLSAEGATLWSMVFEDPFGPGENVYYDDAGVHPLPDGPVRLGAFSHVVGLADGEGLYMLAWTHGVKLYRLRPDGGKSWSALVMPAYVALAFSFLPELLAVDERGRIHVALQIFEDDVHIYGDHFHRPPLTPIGRYDALVERFDPDGAFAGARLLGGPAGDAPTGMTARGGSVLVTGGVRATKHDEPNRTLEWDLFVARGSLDDATSSYRTIDLARDDFAWAMAEGADGTIYLAGRDDYVQVDTNSEVEDGKGLLLALSPDLERRRALSLIGPRDVQVRALRLAPDGRLLFAGWRDGPLTHTEPARQNNEGFLGATRLEAP